MSTSLSQAPTIVVKRWGQEVSPGEVAIIPVSICVALHVTVSYEPHTITGVNTGEYHDFSVPLKM